MSKKMNKFEDFYLHKSTRRSPCNALLACNRSVKPTSKTGVPVPTTRKVELVKKSSEVRECGISHAYSAKVEVRFNTYQRSIKQHIPSVIYLLSTE